MLESELGSLIDDGESDNGLRYAPSESSTAAGAEGITKNDEVVRKLDNTQFELTARNVQMFEEMCQREAQKAEKLFGGAEESPMSKKDSKRQQQFEDAINSGQVDPRSALGQQLAQLWKDKDSEVGKKYFALNRAEASEFRLELAKKEFQKFKQEKQHTKSWKRVDTTQGEYRPLGWIVGQEGGWDDPEAVEGVKVLVNRCMWMGSPWWMINPQTGRVNYLYLKFKFKEEFSKAWTSFTAHYNEAKDIAKRPPVPPTPGAAEVQTSQQETQSQEVPTSTRGTPSEKGSKEKRLWQECAKLRAKTLAAKAGAEQLLEEISSNPKWAWAKNKENEGNLRMVLKQLNDSYSEFHKELLTSTSGNKTLKKKHDPEVCKSELEGFLATEFALDKLMKLHTTLVTRHAVD